MGGHVTGECGVHMCLEEARVAMSLEDFLHDNNTLLTLCFRAPHLMKVVFFILFHERLGKKSTRSSLIKAMDTPERFSIVFFVVMNVSYISFTWVLLRERKNLVLVTLWTNVVVYTVLFVYTVVSVKTVSVVSTTGLLVATHVCNFVSVVHVYVMDLMFWHTGWTDARAEYETFQWSVKAPTNGGVYVV
jgi:hypothetical protein